MASFEDINYNLRTNKSIERKMISEVIQRLTVFTDLESYRYIGLGSAYFTDFTLFHKNLGLHKMISIEKEEGKKARFDFNKPYACIEMQYGSSSNILPNLELDKYLNIIWLDYDGKIQDYILSDISSIVGNSKIGTMFLVSVNVEPSAGNKESRLQEVIDSVGKTRIPSEYEDINLNSKNLPKLVYELIDSQIKKSVLEKSGGNDNVIEYKQLFHYLYKDGATMLTIGGLLINSQLRAKFNRMKTNEIKHVRSGSEPFKINCPNLTYKEVQHLNNLLPCELNVSPNGNIQNKLFKKIPLNDIDVINFEKIYRYYPNFAETNF